MISCYLLAARQETTLQQETFLAGCFTVYMWQIIIQVVDAREPYDRAETSTYVITLMRTEVPL